ncbi:hypothetical protein BCR34DRAFT_590949 [Clohesyomyces aquaticus]|uniref:Dienelactone hydrolase domain-containing protein n=1 Tax=Clohesyomyces aquaticus TaxID=1231657 RepID=A0A1Y1Z4S9_9PLEO|nr:hypothetical protein BCR34DRAFT_590949 [Clohesyomyces aquaticus]
MTEPKVIHDSSMLKNDLSKLTYLAKPSGACCLSSSIHSGTPLGTFQSIAKSKAYISEPPAEKNNNHVLLYSPDVWGLFPNGPLSINAFAAAGYRVFGLGYFRGDPVWKHRKDRHDTTTDPDFDYEACKRKHIAFADTAVPKWAAAVKAEYGGNPGTKFVCVGYYFGAPNVCDELAGDICPVGAFPYPTLLKQHHYQNLRMPLFISCAGVDHTFDAQSRNKAVQIMAEGKKTYHVQLFSGVAHGFALRGDMEQGRYRLHDSDISPCNSLLILIPSTGYL